MNANQARLAALENELADHGGQPADPPLTPAQIRLEAARAARAALDLGSTPSPDAPTVEAGCVVHCVDDHGLVVPRSTSVIGEPALQVFRGDTFTVTAAMLDASRDRNGRPGGVALAADEPEQIKRWGRVRLRVGEAPGDLEPWTFGTPAWAAAREEARKAAWAVTDPSERAVARRAVEERFGPAPVTSTTLNAAEDPSIRAAAAQRARLDASGQRHVSHFEAQEPGAQR